MPEADSKHIRTCRETHGNSICQVNLTNISQGFRAGAGAHQSLGKLASCFRLWAKPIGSKKFSPVSLHSESLNPTLAIPSQNFQLHHQHHPRLAVSRRSDSTPTSSKRATFKHKLQDIRTLLYWITSWHIDSANCRLAPMEWFGMHLSRNLRFKHRCQRTEPGKQLSSQDFLSCMGSQSSNGEVLVSGMFTNTKI